MKWLRSVQPNFNSRDPYGPRYSGISEGRWHRISIHATHTGRDNGATVLDSGTRVFQFTRPIRAAIPTGTGAGGRAQFQFTRPIRAAIFRRACKLLMCRFQFTRPIRAAMVHPRRTRSGFSNFNSRDPYGPRSADALEEREYKTDFNSRDPYGPRCLS